MTVPALQRADYSALPSIGYGVEPMAHLYAMEFSDGTVKVGVTRNPRVRALSLHDQAGRRGSSVHGVYMRCIGAAANPFEVERGLISNLTRVAGPAVRGREWFRGIGIHVAIKAIEAAA